MVRQIIGMDRQCLLLCDHAADLLSDFLVPEAGCVDVECCAAKWAGVLIYWWGVAVAVMAEHAAETVEW